MTKNLVGPPVKGNDFIGRRNEIERAESILEEGNSLLLASPRRVGKSSFAQKMTDIFEEKGYKTIILDLQGIKSEQEFGDRLADSLRRKKAQESRLYPIRDKIGNLMRKVKKFEVKGIGVEFKDDPERFYKSVENLLAVNGKFLIVVDELAVFLQALENTSCFENVESFMNWFRKIRVTMNSNIVWILCSSVSITSYVSNNKISHTINDVVSLSLGEMTLSEARELLLKLCSSTKIETFSDDQIDIILTKIGWKLPFFIQYFFQYYHMDYDKYHDVPIEDAADSIIEQIIKEHQISSWSERLSGYGRYEKAARALLNYLCQPKHKSQRQHLETIIASECPEGADVGVIYAEIRQMLENDGYIMETKEGEIVFRSPIIRQYWLTKFVK